MDYQLGETVYLMFTTRAFSTGVPTVLAGTPVVSAYENDSATQITAGITLGVSHDSVVGMNLLTVVATAANGYESGKDYNFVITTGTVDSVSAVGEVVATMSIGKSASYKSQVILSGGVVDSGTTTTIVDAALLTQATTDHFVGSQVKMTGGTAANLGAVRTITGFTPASDTITFSPALVATVTAADTFDILAGNFGIIEVDSNNRVDIGAVAGTAQTAGDLQALITTVDTVVDAIKVITDQMSFGATTGHLDANVEGVADAAISEGGSDPASPIGQT